MPPLPVTVPVKWPTVWRLPFGYVVKIRRISKALMRRRHGHPWRGLWQDFNDTTKMGTISINTDEPLDVQLEALSHEMRHALTDWDSRVQDMRERIWDKRMATHLHLTDQARDVFVGKN